MNTLIDSILNLQVRHVALRVIQLILSQGLVHPVQIVPYLICMSTDSEQRVCYNITLRNRSILVIDNFR